MKPISLPASDDGQRILGRQAAIGAAAILAVAALLLPLHQTRIPLNYYVPLHFTLESLAILIALLVFSTVWFMPTREATPSAIIISSALFAAAMLDFLHMTSIHGVSDLATPDAGQKSILFRLAARAIVGAGFVAAGFLHGSRPISRTIRYGLSLACLVYAVCIAAVGLLAPSLIPDFFVPGQGTTTLNSVTETILFAIMALTALRYWRISRASEESYDALIFGAVLISALSELFFTSYAVANDSANLLGHIYKIFSYWLIFQSIFILSIRRPYERLAQQASQLLQANEALRVQSLALESTAAPVMVTDVHGFLKWRNRASIAMKPQLAPGLANLFDRALTPDPATAIQMRSRLEAGEVWRGNVRIRLSEGSEAYLDQIVTPVRNESGALEGYVSVSENITSKVVSEARHKRMLESALDGYWVVDLNLGFLEVNEAYAGMSGYSTQELLNMSVPEVEANEDPTEIRSHFQKVKAAGHARFKTVHRQKGGGRLSVDMSATFDDSAGNFYVFVHDRTEQDSALTARLDLERQLQHAQKMQALGQLTGGIAHDFNNILASILGYSNLALSRLVTDHESKLAKYLQEIVSASERARDLVIKMLAFTRTQPGASAGPISPALIAWEVEEMLRPSIPSSIQIRNEIESERLISMDAGDLNQVLVNLVINARDAIADQGWIHIRVRDVHLHEEICAISHRRLSGDYLSVEVEDNGSGIEARHLPSLFDPFFTTKDVGKGTGLGLSIVQGILQRNSGHIVIRSQLGQGTRFQLLFRAQAQASPAEEPGGGADRRLEGTGNGRSIWVVDDEPSVGNFVGELLLDSGFQTTVFHDPVAALEAFECAQQRVDALVTDQTMPGLTGIQLAGLLHEIQPDLPVIVCTGYGDGIPAVDFERLGIHQLLIKPFAGHALLQAINEIFVDRPGSST